MRGDAKTEEPAYKSVESHTCDICGKVGTWDRATWRWYAVAFRVWDRDDVVILCSDACEDHWFKGTRPSREGDDDD